MVPLWKFHITSNFDGQTVGSGIQQRTGGVQGILKCTCSRKYKFLRIFSMQMPAGILKSVYSQELYSSQLARFHVMMKNYFLTYWNREIKIDYWKERSQSQGKVKGNSDKSQVNNAKLWQSNHTFKGLLSLQGSPLICFKVKVPNFLGISSPYCWQLTSACYHIRKVMFFRFSDMFESFLTWMKVKVPNLLGLSSPHCLLKADSSFFCF